MQSTPVARESGSLGPWSAGGSADAPRRGSRRALSSPPPVDSWGAGGSLSDSAICEGETWVSRSPHRIHTGFHRTRRVQRSAASRLDKRNRKELGGGKGQKQVDGGKAEEVQEGKDVEEGEADENAIK